MSKGKLHAILELGRISNLPTVVTNCSAAWFLAGGTWSLSLVWMIFGACLLYLGGTTLNDAFDVEFDRKHRPERPIPSGVLPASAVWTIGILDLVIGCALIVFLTAACPWLALALAAAILAYDYIHKKSIAGVFVMGLCRLLLYLTAASAIGTGFLGAHWNVTIWAVALFAYIVGLTFTARGESSGAALMRWPLAFLMLPIVAFAIAQVEHFHPANLAFAAGFVAWIVWSLRLLKGASLARIGRSVSAMLAGIILIDAMAVATVNPAAALVLLAFFPVTLGFQRWIAAT